MADIGVVGVLLPLSVALSLDTLRVAIPLGALRPTPRRQVQLAIAFGLSESLMPLLGMAIGKPLGAVLEAGAGFLGTCVLAGCGAWIAGAALRNVRPETVMDGRLLLVGLPLSLGLDNLLAGLGLALLGVPLLPAAVLFGLASAIACGAGLRLGRMVARRVPTGIDFASGVSLVAIAILGILIG